MLVVEGLGGYPLPENIPIEEFKSLESLKLVGEVDRLLDIIRPNGDATTEFLSAPSLSLLELHWTFHEWDFPFETLLEILRERKEGGHRVKTVRVTGEYRQCSNEEALELSRLVDVLMLD